MGERLNRDSEKNIAVLLAGGTGERMRQEVPKQLLKVAGKAIMDHTLFALQESDDIDEILVMMTKSHLKEAEEITKQYSKVWAVLPGGSTRSETSQRALDAINERYEEANVLFHDAVRPFITNDIIKRCVDGLEDYNAIDTVIPSADTIIQTDGDVITDVPARSELRRGQTPQAFKLSTISRAYEISRSDDSFEATDDCGVVLKYMPEESIGIVDGHETNIKVTEPLDMVIADRLFQMKSAELNVFTDAERVERLRDRTLVVFGGSYGIGGEIVDMANEHGANVFSYSRSETGTDVTSESAVKEALEKAHQETGRIDYIVNTAGQLVISPLEEMTTEELEHSVKINYTAPAIIAKLAKPYLDETGGHLLLFTSSSYTRGRENYSMYSSSKAATVNLTQALAEEWYQDGVSINCINPERTATPMRTRAFGEEDPSKLLTADKVAESSIDALIGGMTGQVFDVRITN